jgi:hypothetical protein
MRKSVRQHTFKVFVVNPETALNTRFKACNLFRSGLLLSIAGQINVPFSQTIRNPTFSMFHRRNVSAVQRCHRLAGQAAAALESPVARGFRNLAER